MAMELVPHSAEWFEALRCFNPQQAEITKRLIELAGRSDICSICGDTRSASFTLKAAEMPGDKVVTIRLCDGCRTIRESAYGETFEAMR